MFQRIDPSKLAEEMRIAIVEYKKTQRVFEEVVRLKKEKEDTMYLHYRFFSNEKCSIKDAESKANVSDEVKEVVSHLKKAQELRDDCWATLRSLEIKIELIKDANATARTEIKLGGFQT
tara:strand:+ start:258 stop:614 length:357 start_codon:yes stop_codon:yes gene_type:complete